MRRSLVFPVVAAIVIGSLLHGQQNPESQKQNLQFFRDLAETRGYKLGRPVKPIPTPDGNTVIFLRGGARDPVLRLYELNATTGKAEEILAPDRILGGAEEHLSVEERARRERMRQTFRGFTDFELSKDGSKILETLEGKLYVIRRADRTFVELPIKGWIDPHLSPDGRSVAAVKDGELYVIDIASRKEKQLTSGATETLTHGLAEFAAQEEMERFSGFWWSPDSNYLATQETDVSGVEKHFIANPLQPSDPPNQFFYPRAGTANAKVRLGVISKNGGETTWGQWDAEKYPYLTRVSWMEGGPLLILVQTRNQREEKLLTVDASTGATQELLGETDSAWLNLNEGPHWLKDGSGFLWATERRGDWQLEVRAPNGTLARELTPVGLNFQKLFDVDEVTQTVTFAAAPDPREKHIFRVSLRGGKPEQLTTDSGFHDAFYSQNHQTYAYEYSLMDGRWGMEFRKRDGTVIAQVPSVAEKLPVVPDVEFLKIGPRQFDAALLRPNPFVKGKKYPVILEVYAGPTSKMVQSLKAAYLIEQWMANQGFIVAMLDGRGTPGHGREWERCIQGNLIDIALQDQVEGLKALGEKYPEMDLARVGVIGWSFGGYFTAMATIRRPDVFQCGVAGAPVVDWEDYDTFYTERYLDLPSANPEGYKKSNVLTYATQLRRPLLIIHGLTDDNVYFEHSMKLMDALFKAQLQYEFLPLLSTHMVPDPAMQLNRETRIINFFKTHLNSSPPRH